MVAGLSSYGTPGSSTPRYPTLRNTIPQETTSRSSVATARIRPESSASSRLRTSSTASTRPPRDATGEVRKRRRTARGLPSGMRAASSRRISTFRCTTLDAPRAPPHSPVRARAPLDRAARRRRRVAELPSSVRSPRRLHRTAATDDEDLADPRGDDRGDRGVRRIRRCKLLGCQREHAGDVERDVPVPDDDGPLVRRGRTSMSWKSGWPLYQATNSVAGHDPGRSSPGCPSRLSVCEPTA